MSYDPYAQQYGQPSYAQFQPRARPRPRPFHALPTLLWLLAAGFAIGVLIALR